MARYPNGGIPRDQLILLGSGTDSNGYWEHLATPGTAQKHFALVALGYEASGRELRISSGWNVYRPIPAQKDAKRDACARGRCQDAATPGFSSHGGEYQGADALAIDYSNWSYVFGSREAFYAACRAVGLVPGVFDWEPWHVIDRDPYRPVAGKVTAPLKPIETGGIRMYLFNGVSNPNQYYLATYDGRTLKVRPTLGVEAKILLGAVPAIPRGQLYDDEVIDLCAQGGYEFKDGVGYYDGVPSYFPAS